MNDSGVQVTIPYTEYEEQDLVSIRDYTDEEITEKLAVGNADNSLANLNDEGYTFPAIADIIEKYL